MVQLASLGQMERGLERIGPSKQREAGEAEVSYDNLFANTCGFPSWEWALSEHNIPAQAHRETP